LPGHALLLDCRDDTVAHLAFDLDSAGLPLDDGDRVGGESLMIERSEPVPCDHGDLRSSGVTAGATVAA